MKNNLDHEDIDFDSLLNTSAPLFWVLELFKEKSTPKEASQVETWLLDEGCSWNSLAETVKITGRPEAPVSENMILALCETKARMMAPLDRIIESTQALPFNQSLSLMTPETSERIFLRAFALNRAADKALAVQEFASLSASSESALQAERSQNFCVARYRESLKDRSYLEELVNCLNRDEDAFVIKETQVLLRQKNLDVISQIRCLAILGLAASELGQFDLLETALSLEKTLLLKMPLQSLYQTWKRRRAHAYLRQNKYTAASSLIEEGLNETENLLPVHALFLGLRIELSLVRGALSDAQAQVKKLQELIDQGAIPKESTQINVFVLEISLRSQSTFQGDLASLYESIPMLSEVASKESASQSSLFDLRPSLNLKGGAQIRAALLFGRVLMKQKLYSSAEVWISVATSASEAGSYLPLLLDAHFHNAGLHFIQRNSIAMKRSLEAARDLSRTLGLTLKQACFQYIVSFLRQKGTTQLKPLLELITNSPMDRHETEIVYLLRHYGFLTLNPRRILAHNGQILDVPESEFWGDWLVRPILLWSKSEGILFLRTAQSSTFLNELLLSKGLVQAVDLFLNQQLCISLEQVHGLNSQVPYHSLKHEAQSRSMITRLRKEFGALGIEVIRNEITGKYEATHKETLVPMLAQILSD
jgi:hypothetical protein